VNKATKRQLKEIIRRQNEIKEKARVKRNLRLMFLAQKRDEAAKNKQQEKPKRVIRIRDRHLLQMIHGTLSERNEAHYRAIGVTQATIEALVAQRPRLMEKLQFAGLTLEPVSGQQ
jgi:hypothetical protein